MSPNAQDEFDLDLNGSVAINPTKGRYLIEVIKGSTTQMRDGSEIPRKRDDGCPMIMYQCKLVMDDKGSEEYRGHNFNIMVAKDEHGSKILRKMIKAFLPELSGVIKTTPGMMNGKMAWTTCEQRGNFFNTDPEGWTPMSSVRVETAIRSTDHANPASAPKNQPALPF